jgi:putative ATPase
MEPQTFYTPTDRGHEKRVSERLAWWAEMREKRRDG